MTWYADAPQGNEAAKCRFDVLPYLAKGGADIGCGPQKVWPHLVGIDNGLDAKMFGIPVHPDIMVGDAARLRLFADEAFPAVFSSHLLEHMVDPAAALAEWWRVLKTGGHLCLYLPHRELYPNIGEPGANPDHKHDFIPEDVLALMETVAPDFAVELNQTRSEGLEYSFLLVLKKLPAGAGQHLAAPASPEKSAAVVRVGGHGDALWASSPLALFKEMGYHTTVYTAHTGAEVLQHDPHIDRIISLPDGILSDEDLIAYWAHEAVKYDRFVNLIGSVEGRLLAHATDPTFYLPAAVRHKFMNMNYLEMVHDYAELPHDFRQKFYANEFEAAWAREQRARLDGPVVVINPAGSGPTKFWPHSMALARTLAGHGVHSVILGDLSYAMAADIEDVEPYIHVVGKEWPVRAALAYAQVADAVVATESLIANSVAQEDMLKVVTLSHSSNENLTKHWKNTAAIEPKAIACHPCHRIHGHTFAFCQTDTNTGCSACQAAAGPNLVAGIVLDWLRIQHREAA